MDWRSIENDREKYAAYLCSREWAEKREAVRERADGKCERCKVLPMEACHHLTYARKYEEELSDLQAICNPCHEFTHGKDDFDPKANARFIDYLSRMNRVEYQYPWLRPGFAFWDAFECYPLIPVIVLWVAHRASQAQLEKSLAELDRDLSDVSDLTIIDWHEVHHFPGELSSFWVWLFNKGPTEHPHGSAAAFNRCMELALRV